MIFVYEIGVHDGTSASTIYLSTDGYTSLPTDTPANTYYMDRVKAPCTIERHLYSSGDGVSGGTTQGQSTASFGNISAINGHPYGGTELIDNWRTLSFRSITIKSLDSRISALASAVTRFVGLCDNLVSTRALDEYELAIKGRLADLDKPLLINTYGGTTTAAGLGADGNADRKGQIKQKIWGTKNNAPCTAVNVFDLIYQVNDGAVTSIAPYDGGIALTSGGDFASVNLMVQASIVAGQFCTCLALGLFRLGGSPAGEITADVVEGGALASSRTAAQIVGRMLTWFATMYPSTAASLSFASTISLDTKNSAECGIIVSGTESALTAINRVLISVGAWFLPTEGSASTFDVGRLDAQSLTGASVATFDIDDGIGDTIERIETGDSGKGIPLHRVIVKYDQLGAVQSGTQLFGAVSDDRKAYLATEWRQTDPADAPSVLAQFPNSTTLTIETCLVRRADADAEAARVLALRSVIRDCYRMKLPLPNAQACVFGSTVTLTSVDRRMGLADGKAFTPIGRIDDFSDPPTITLDLWG